MVLPKTDISSTGSQIKPPDYKSSFKPLYLLIIIAVVSLTVFLTFLFFTNRKSASPTDNLNIQPAPVVSLPVSSLTVATQPVSSSQTAVLNNKTIVYLREGNIWTVTSDGTSLRQVTKDSDQIITYKALTYKNKNEIVFAKCRINENKCLINNKNLLTNEEKEEFNITGEVSKIAWNDTEKLLAYTKTGEKENALYFIQKDQTKKIIDFEQSLGRGGGYNDELFLSWSANDKYLLVVNTLTQPNNKDDKTTIWVFDKTGNLLTKINKGSASKARWIDNSGFIYQSGSVFQHDINGQDKEIGSFEGIISSIRDKNILYWNSDDKGVISVKSYSLSNKTSTDVAKNISLPYWVNNDLVIGLKTVADSDSMFGFTQKGLVTHNIITSEERILDSNSTISQFIVIP